MRLAILGFGLIGGSIARSLAERDPGAWHVTCWSRSLEQPRAALRRGLIAAVAPDAATAAESAELIVLAASPQANLELVDRLGPVLAGGQQTLTDVSSVQGPIAARAASQKGLRFVGGHPMSGRERRGFGAATPDLFVDRPWIVVAGEAAQDKDVDRVRELARACGARPVEMDATTHDGAVGGVSHLPLLASLCLVEAVTSGPDWETARGLRAGAWRDMTRLARGDAELGAGILALNAPVLAGWVGRYREVLGRWEQTLNELALGSDTPGTGLEGQLREIADLAEESATPS